MKINAENKDFKELNNEVRSAAELEITIDNCTGHRYIGSGLEKKHITINGVPGNDLGCYLNGGTIKVNGNAQDATGDTMNEGAIIIDGSSGDATGYAMRGGKILVKGNAGYRAGIHMKEYKTHHPLIVIGGEAGSFLGEYQAGGTIIVLGLNSQKKTPVGNLCGTGMHGGRMYLRCEELPSDLPAQVEVTLAKAEDMAAIDAYLDDFCQTFGVSKQDVLSKQFYVLSPNTKNPYKSLYTFN
jgi:glutamate synthase domain-containing protein 3